MNTYYTLFGATITGEIDSETVQVKMHGNRSPENVVMSGTFHIKKADLIEVAREYEEFHGRPLGIKISLDGREAVLWDWRAEEARVNKE